MYRTFSVRLSLRPFNAVVPLVNLDQTDPPGPDLNEMMPFEKIENHKILELLQHLIKDKTLVKVSLPKDEYESLTVVTELRDQDSLPQFRIAAPEGLAAVLKDKNAPHLNFEFTARDHLNHRFEAQLRALTQSDVWLTCPDHIKRFQMRRNFRINAPRGAELAVTIDDTDIRMVIVNISLGGAFCHCLNTHKPLVENHRRIEDLDLVFTLRNKSKTIQIQAAEIRRMDLHARPKHFGVAYEFVQIGKQAKKQLTQQIYDLQREFLQNRLKLRP